MGLDFLPTRAMLIPCSSARSESAHTAICIWSKPFARTASLTTLAPALGGHCPTCSSNSGSSQDGKLPGDVPASRAGRRERLNHVGHKRPDRSIRRRLSAQVSASTHTSFGPIRSVCNVFGTRLMRGQNLHDVVRRPADIVGPATKAPVIRHRLARLLGVRL